MRIFLKLGGSIITDKDKPYTARNDVIQRIGGEISSAFSLQKDLQLLVGHGSGSFGHFAAKEYNTRESVNGWYEWLGFQKVWLAARTLNQIVIEEFAKANLPVISLPPSSSIITSNRKIKTWNTGAIESTLENGLIPVIQGDVIFDEQLGGIILSTEDLFMHLIHKIKPDLILLAGKEKGVWEDFPNNSTLIPTITPDNYSNVYSGITASTSMDVTGGMASKVHLSMEMVKSQPGVEVRIFSGVETGNLFKALTGESIGTIIKS